MLGQEIELSDSLTELRISAETVKETASSLPPAATETVSDNLEKVEQDEIKQILDEASRSPKIALITLGGHIEIAARRALASVGLLQKNRHMSTTEAIDRLIRQYGGLPGDIVGSTKLFMSVRNKIVHSADASEDDIISALDSGITILRTLKSLPSEKNIVLHYNIPLYQDAQCTTELNDVKGLILETISPGGVKKYRRIFPTTQDSYEVGQVLSWEWSLTKTWDMTWYIDPDDQEKRLAWGSSGEFIGRPLDSIKTSDFSSKG